MTVEGPKHQRSVPVCLLLLLLPSFIAGTRIQKMLEIAGDYSLEV